MSARSTTGLNNDLICDIEGAVNDLMELLEEKDPLHMEALKAAVAP